MLAKPNKVIPNPLQCSCFGKENPKYNKKKNGRCTISIYGEDSEIISLNSYKGLGEGNMYYGVHMIY